MERSQKPEAGCGGTSKPTPDFTSTLSMDLCICLPMFGFGLLTGPSGEVLQADDVTTKVYGMCARQDQTLSYYLFLGFFRGSF